MNCLEFERQLDAGELATLGNAAVAHTHECARCTQALARARSLERQLERAFSAGRGAPVTGSVSGDALPAAFTAAVMVRVERGEARGVRWTALPDALPWWARLAAEPGVALACVLSALLLWKGETLLTLSRGGLAALTTAPAQLSAVMQAHGWTVWVQSLTQALAPGPQAHWSVVAAMLIGTAPVFGLFGWLMWQVGGYLAMPGRSMARR